MPEGVFGYRTIGSCLRCPGGEDPYSCHYQEVSTVGSEKVQFRNLKNLELYARTIHHLTDF